MAKRPKPSTMRNKADRIFSLIIRSRGQCERCGQKPPKVKLETSHVFSRRYAWIRTDENNAFCLCSGCHRFVTANPTEHANFARGRWAAAGMPQAEDVLMVARDSGKLPSGFWEDEYSRLVEVADRLGIDY